VKKFLPIQTSPKAAMLAPPAVVRVVCRRRGVSLTGLAAVVTRRYLQAVETVACVDPPPAICIQA